MTIAELIQTLQFSIDTLERAGDGLEVEEDHVHDVVATAGRQMDDDIHSKARLLLQASIAALEEVQALEDTQRADDTFRFAEDRALPRFRFFSAWEERKLAALEKLSS